MPFSLLKKINFSSSLFLSLLVLSVALVSCSKAIMFQTSPVVPAARGTVSVNKDKNNNYAIGVNITDLAEANRLQDSKKTYVVWMVTDRDSIQNIGQLNSSMKGFGSKRLSASLKTVSSFKPSKIFITAEQNAGIQTPDSQVVLTTSKF